MLCDRCFQEIVNQDLHGWSKCPYEARPANFGVSGDGIPGGIIIRHMGREPRRYYSKTEIKRAANERGLTWADDSPKPYRVSWSGIRKDKKLEEQ